MNLSSDDHYGRVLWRSKKKTKVSPIAIHRHDRNDQITIILMCSSVLVISISINSDECLFFTSFRFNGRQFEQFNIETIESHFTSDDFHKHWQFNHACFASDVHHFDCTGACSDHRQRRWNTRSGIQDGSWLVSSTFWINLNSFCLFFFFC